MSPDQSDGRLTGKLIATGNFGTRIIVSNSNGLVVARGVGKLDEDLAEGVYAIEWIFGSQREETLTRVQASKDANPTTPLSPPESQFKHSALAEVANISRSHSKTSARPHETAIVLALEGSSQHFLEICNTISLVDTRDQEVSILDHSEWQPLKDPRLMTWVEVTPGRYRLRYKALTGETYEQTIPVIQGRQTLIRMTVAEGTLLSAEGEGFTPSEAIGIDPSKSLITTVSKSTNQPTIDSQLLVSQLLLQDLSAGTGSLSAPLIKELHGKLSDPILHTFAALVVLNCLEKNVCPSPEIQASGDINDHNSQWLIRAKKWLGPASKAGMPPDATAALWKIAKLKRTTEGTAAVPESRTANSIQMPPMMECAWRWALAQSAIDPAALQGFASIRAAAKSAGGTSPWLCWHAAAAKGITVGYGQPTQIEMGKALNDVADRVNRLKQQLDVTSKAAANTRIAQILPPDLGATALKVEQAVSNVEPSEQAGEELVANLAVALGLPSSQLSNRLDRTVKALDGALKKQMAKKQGGNEEPKESPKSAPALQRAVRHPDDPNKGRFGGAAQLGDFKLSAKFKETKNRNWVSIFLKVKGPAKKNEVVELYFHDSFRPPKRTIKFAKGFAKLKLTAWGGFTVGAWIPSHQIELELDLALESDAPRIIRER